MLGKGRGRKWLSCPVMNVAQPGDVVTARPHPGVCPRVRGRGQARGGRGWLTRTQPQ